MEQRKIKRTMGIGGKIIYESLKPAFNNEDECEYGDCEELLLEGEAKGEIEWERRGKFYDIKGLYSLIKGNVFEFRIDSETLEDLAAYDTKLQLKKEAHQK